MEGFRNLQPDEVMDVNLGDFCYRIFHNSVELHLVTRAVEDGGIVTITSYEADANGKPFTDDGETIAMNPSQTYPTPSVFVDKAICS